MSHHASLLLQQGPDPLLGRTDLLAQRTELESLDGGGCRHSADKVMAILPPEACSCDAEAGRARTSTCTPIPHWTVQSSLLQRART